MLELKLNNCLITKSNFKQKFKSIDGLLKKELLKYKSIYVFEKLNINNYSIDLSKVKSDSLIVFNNLNYINIVESSNFKNTKNLNLIFVFKNSNNLTYIRDFSSKNLKINIQKIVINSRINFTNLFFDSELLNFNSDIYLYNKTKYFENNLVLLNNTQKNIIDIRLIHSSRNTTSKITTRNVLKGSSFIRFDGLIDIPKGSYNSDAYLQSNTMMLSKKAKSINIPKLEIIPKKVKASHSASNEYISKDILFFLESKGISKVKSKKIIVSSFLKEFITNYNLFSRNYIYEKIKNKL